MDNVQNNFMMNQPNNNTFGNQNMASSNQPNQNQMMANQRTSSNGVGYYNRRNQQARPLPFRNGRMITSEADILPSEISMDGPNVFVKDDGSEILVKYWDPQGNIQTDHYIFSSRSTNAPVTLSPDMKVLYNEIDQLKGMVATITNTLYSNPAVQQCHKMPNPNKKKQNNRTVNMVNNEGDDNDVQQ